MNPKLEQLQEHARQQLANVAQGLLPPCKICGQATRVFDVVDFSKTCDLNPYPRGLSGCPVYYHLCNACGFLFTTFCDGFQSGDWQKYIYDDEYAAVDPDYLDRRPRQNADVIDSYLRNQKSSIVGLDYGGGNGLTTALLRERGYRFDTYDPFGHQDLSLAGPSAYEFCSAFEVAEHVPDPSQFMSKVVSLLSPSRVMILIGTQVHEGQVSEQSRLGWWYVAPRNGHISIYSRRSLEVLAAKFDLELISMSRSTHFMVRGFNRSAVRNLFVKAWLRRRLSRLARF